MKEQDEQSNLLNDLLDLPAINSGFDGINVLRLRHGLGSNKGRVAQQMHLAGREDCEHGSCQGSEQSVVLFLCVCVTECVAITMRSTTVIVMVVMTLTMTLMNAVVAKKGHRSVVGRGTDRSGSTK